jgi:hypothetical protein
LVIRGHPNPEPIHQPPAQPAAERGDGESGQREQAHPDRRRRVIEELSVAETGQLLGIEAATVKTRVHRARRLLQRGLTDELATALQGAFAFDGARCDRLVAQVFERLSCAGGA